MIRVRGLFQKALKNRSSKNLKFMTGPGTKNVLWSWSNEALHQKSAAIGDKSNAYELELNRRSRNAAKRKTPRPAAKKRSEGGI